MNDDPLESALRQAADAIREAEALLIGAGAGMGVDSGLPDFRGNEGFWNAYPPFRERKLSFVDLANPAWFGSDPRQAWGFYGHRLQLYRTTDPHDGFRPLRAWAKGKPGGYFVFTSNVDGHFERAGFAASRIVECHGSLHHWQCSIPCGEEIWEAGPEPMIVDQSDFRASLPLPMCRNCGAMARPNVLMFDDDQWLERRTDRQCQRYERWRNETLGRRVTTIECGAGTGVPTVRHHCQRQPGTLIRINLHEPAVPEGGISIPLGASEALARLAAMLEE